MAKSVITRITDAFYDRMRSKSAWSSATAEPVLGFDGLDGHKYALLTTYKRNGDPVPSPVWFGRSDGRLYFTTEATSPKVARMRNNPHVRIAPCAVNGKPLGSPAEGTARVLPPDEIAAAESVIAANYGSARKAYEAFGRATSVSTAYIEVTPTIGTPGT
ncbi:PPOX class F420-dependent oxidoreductase [Gordonia soli]|uniref:Pyridoxamine 5'-phosphate oxidase N-terminal domain-containing protein n=1 Tax=Gordonia soli NBRC 108243 TaxID=1223545 RepID=M0QGV9_9ACTN|nr:PPOX class F420-dependent oxidoreductase [Gordonia soli]GAC66657.1 hypothetical protein GS4_03_01050 [Gordonia soli NBRC 108243]